MTPWSSISLVPEGAVGHDEQRRDLDTQYLDVPAAIAEAAAESMR
ncbi:hypothetical protein [Arsenicicoccus sp. oral taxon 190]|nr:hypothetical protein [Arsenicicoccus sp. oral taxon 190]